MAEYGYVGDVTLEEFAEIKKAFPVLVGIGVTESEGKQYIALGVPSELGDKVGGMYQSIVAVFFDDDLRKRVADVVWGDETETESEDERDPLIDDLIEQTELLLQEHKRQMNNTLLETISVPLCNRCIARAKANDEYISVGRITKAKKCYFCDDTDTQLYMCSVEP